jgi:hypothetical protein
MARVLPRVLMLASLWLVAPTVRAESHNPADYPLRIHIYRRSETTFYHNRQAEEAKGEGRANLFESGQPKGVDFQFECDTKLQTSSGYETFPAKWKKVGQELVILQPQFGKSGYDTCRLKVLIKDFVYVSRNGTLNSEPVDVFKQWMVKHDYDPEHGKNSPTQTTPAATKPTDPAPPIGSPQAPESITPPQ